MNVSKLNLKFPATDRIHCVALSMFLYSTGLLAYFIPQCRISGQPNIILEVVERNFGRENTSVTLARTLDAAVYY